MTTITEEKAALDYDPPHLSHIPSLRALAALLVLSLRQQTRGWRLIVLSLLYLLPGALAVITYATPPRWHTPTAEQLDTWFVYTLLASAMAPLTALLCAAGVIRDDVEDQTLTYLLLRPLPRWTIYVIKILASMIAAILLTVVFSAATLLLINAMAGTAGGTPMTEKVVRAAMIFAAAQVAYCALFGLMGILMRWSLVVGVAYIIFFEGLLAAADTLMRKMTVIYYFRVLVLRLLNPAEAEKMWSLNIGPPGATPSATNCMLILLIAAAVFVAIGGLLLCVREFRMKTPEGA